MAGNENAGEGRDDRGGSSPDGYLLCTLARLPPPRGVSTRRGRETKEKQSRYSPGSGKTVSKRMFAWAKRDALIQRLRGRSHRTGGRDREREGACRGTVGAKGGRMGTLPGAQEAASSKDL